MSLHLTSRQSNLLEYIRARVARDGQAPTLEEIGPRLWPGARMISTRGCGHNRIADDPGVIAATLRFLRGEAVGERVVSSPNLPFGLA